MGSGVANSQKIKNKMTIWPRNSPAGYIPQRNESKDSKRYLCINVHSSIIHNSQKVKKKSSHWPMNQHHAVDTYSGMLFSLREEGNPDTCYVDEHWRDYIQWNKPVARGQTLYDFSDVRFLDFGCQGLGTGENEFVLNGHIQFRLREMTVETDGGDGCTTWLYLMPQNYTLKHG